MAFAEIEPTPAGILSFAQKHGNLMTVCPLLVWYEEALAIKRAFFVWQLLCKGDILTLRSHFRWRKCRERVFSTSQSLGAQSVVHDDRYLAFDSHPDGISIPPQYPIRRAIEPIAGTGHSTDHWVRLLSSGHVTEVAQAYLQQVVADRFEKDVGLTLAWYEGRSPSRVLMPKNLLGAIWLQFEESMIEEWEFRRCNGPGCGKWFAVRPGVGRADKQYCSDLCRVKAHQERKKKRSE